LTRYLAKWKNAIGDINQKVMKEKQINIEKMKREIELANEFKRKSKII